MPQAQPNNPFLINNGDFIWNEVELEVAIRDVEPRNCRRCGRGIAANIETFFDQYGFDILCSECFVLITAENGLDIGEAPDVARLGERVDIDVKPKKKLVPFEAGEIITSKRQFGLEFEVNLGREGQVNLRGLIERDFQLVHDGSVNAGIEVVSPILKGKSGEQKVLKMCEGLAKVRASADDSCGLHVHVDAEDFFDDGSYGVFSLGNMQDADKLKDYNVFILDPNIAKELKDENYGLFEAIYNTRRVDVFSMDELLDYITEKCQQFDVCWASEGILAQKNTRYLAPQGSRGARVKYNDKIKEEADIKAYRGEPCAVSVGYNKFMVVDTAHSQQLLVVGIPKNHIKVDGERLKRLQRVAAFYVAFDDVLAAMLPCDRRDNDFAIRTSTRLSLRDIVACESTLDFFNAWTKTKDLRTFRLSLAEQRHESRYYGINFRALLKHGTIEIRYHAGTTDAMKALHWTALHQRIVDIASDLKDKRFGTTDRNGRLDLAPLEKADMVIDMNYKPDLFFAKLALPKATEAYLRKRIKEFAKEDKNFVDSLIADDK